MVFIYLNGFYNPICLQYKSSILIFNSFGDSSCFVVKGRGRGKNKEYKECARSTWHGLFSNQSFCCKVYHLSFRHCDYSALICAV